MSILKYYAIVSTRLHYFSIPKYFVDEVLRLLVLLMPCYLHIDQLRPLANAASGPCD